MSHHTWTAFLEDLLGSSWRTKLLGLILILLGAPLVAIGGVFSVWDSTRDAGIVFISQGVIMLTTGVGFFLTRDHSASERKAKELEQEIVVTRIRGDMEHGENVARLADLDRKVAEVPIVVAEAIKPVVAEVVEQVKPQISSEVKAEVKDELRQEQRRDLR